MEAGRDVGCTLVALYLTPETYQWISIGDSVLGLCREGVLTRLNRDHNLGNQLDEQLAAGEITEAYAESRESERSHLTSGLGLEEIPQMDISDPFALEAGDQFVLATDGLTNTLAHGDIEGILLSGERDDMAGLLVRSALAAKNEKQDNITVVAVTVQGENETVEGE
jgi:PPM family protein phosphatase